MSSPRPEKVNEMVDAMLDALRLEDDAEDATADEVFSASMTLSLRTVHSLLKMGASPDRLRMAIERLLAACDPHGSPRVH